MVTHCFAPSRSTSLTPLLFFRYIDWHSHDTEEQFLCDAQQTGSHGHDQQQQAEEDMQREIPAPQLSRGPWEKKQAQSQ